MIQKCTQDIHKAGKIAERFIRTSKSKINKQLTSISKNIYCELTDIVNKHNNTYQRTLKMEPIDVKSRTSIDFDVDGKDLRSLSLLCTE